MGVEFPDMRTEVVELLREAVAPGTDQLWITADQPWDTFDEWWNVMDDLLPHGAEASIGAVLVDQREADAVGRFLAVRDALYAEVGNADYTVYRSHPRWREVIDAAADALRVLAPQG